MAIVMSVPLISSVPLVSTTPGVVVVHVSAQGLVAEALVLTVIAPAQTASLVQLPNVCFAIMPAPVSRS